MDRRDRLKQGEEAKKRVMARLSGGGGQSTDSTSTRDANSWREKRRAELTSQQSSASTGSWRDQRKQELIANDPVRKAEAIRSLAPELFNPQQNLDAFNKMVRPKESRPQLAQPTLPTSLPSIQKQLETATTAFTPQSVNKDLRPIQGPAKPTIQSNFDRRIAAGREETEGKPFQSVVNRLLEPITALGAITEKPAKIAEQYYTPAMGPAALGSVSNYIGTGISKVAPFLGNSSKALPTIAREAIKEGATGALAGAGQSLANNPQGGFEAAGKQALYGGALGVGGAGVLVGGAKGVGAVLNAPKDILRGAINAADASSQPRIASTVPRAQRATEFTPPTPNEPIETPPQGWFSRLFGDQKVGITPFGSGRSDRVVETGQQIVNNPLRNNLQGAIEGTKQATRSTYQNTVDYLQPLKSINRQTYDAAMDASRANNMANTIIRDKFVDNEGNVIGSSLNDIMAKTRGLGKNVDDYLVLRHAITRMERGERVYDDALKMTPEKARAAVLTLETRYPALKGIGQEWDQFNTNLLDSGVREGLISEAARDAMRTQNPNYASMRRQFTVGEKLSQPKWGGGGSGFSGQKAPIQAVSPTGSTRKIVTPLRSAIEQTYAWKNAELRNRSMQEIVKSIQMDPEGMKGIVEIVKKPATSYKSLDDALREGGSDEFLELLDNDFKSLFTKNASGDENIVRAMIKGQPVFVKVHNPEAVKALLGLGAEQAGIVLKTMQTLSNATKRGATGLLAPMFAVKSVTADTVQAAIQSPNAFKHLTVDVPHAVISSIGDLLNIPGMRKLAQDFRRSGGEYSSLLRGDRQLNTTIGSLRRDPFLSPKGIAKGVVGTVKAPFKALEKVSDASENLNRMAAFRRALRGKERTPENVRAAINAARESTTNFSRKGALSREAEAFAPYSNAAVQGIYRINKAFIKNPVKTIAGIGALVITPKLYEYAKFNDDPDYQKLPARERYRNIIISKNADGTFNKQFMPPEYLAFGAFVTDVLNDVVNNDPEAYKGTLNSIANAFTPPLVSGALQGATQGGGVEQSLIGLANASVLAPAVSTISNKSFTGAPIVPKRLEPLPPELQSDERSTAPAKWIGEKLKMSPMKVDYLLRAYGGDPARLILPLTSDAGAGTQRNTLLKNFIVDPVFTNTLSDDYYSAKEKLSQARSANTQAGRDLPSWYSEELYKLANSTAQGEPAKRLSDLNAEKRTINGNTLLSAEEKARRLRDVQSEINGIYLDVNTKLQEAGVPMPRR